MEVFKRGKNGRKRFTIYVTLHNVHKDVSRVYRCVTANMKVIKTQSEAKPSYFPKGSFGEKV